MMYTKVCVVWALLLSCVRSSPLPFEEERSQHTKRQSTVPDYFTGQPSSPKLQWFTCFPEYGGECARLEVPYDYSKPVAGKVFKLAIIKIPARTDVPYKGVQFVSFLAPPFTDFVGAASFIFQQGAFAGYDIVAWDPRGSGHTTPLLKCFPDQLTQTAYAQSLASDQFTPLGAFNGSFPPTDKNLKANLRSVSAAYKQLTDGCINLSAEILPYMGTVDNARDLRTIISLLPAAGVKFMTYYGPPSAIGLTYAALYPTGFDGMLFDGAVNAEELFDTGLNSPATVQDAEKALALFFDRCAAAGPCADPTAPIEYCQTGCYFWKPTAAQVKARYEALKAKYYNKLWKSSTLNTQCGECTLTFDRIAHVIVDAFYYPAGGIRRAASVSKALLELENGSAPDGGEVEAVKLYRGPPSDVDVYGKTLPCLDAKHIIRGEGDLIDHEQLMNRTSSQEGIAIAAQEVQCSTWPKDLKLKNPYKGDWRTHKHNSMVFVANTACPYGSLSSVKAIASRFDNARLITINEIGDTSFFGGYSQCLQDYVGNWIVNGVLPPSKAKCNDVVSGAFGIGYA